MNIDTKIFYKINHLPHNKFSDALALIIHYLTYYGWIFLIPIVYYFMSGNPAKKLLAKQLTLAIVLAGVANDLILQWLIARPRPFSVLDNVITVGKLPSEYSFPSGHAAIAFAFAVTFLLVTPRSLVGYLLLLFAFIIAFGRIYMGFHYPSDVIVGAVLGTICACVSVAVFKAI